MSAALEVNHSSLGLWEWSQQRASKPLSSGLTCLGEPGSSLPMGK